MCVIISLHQLGLLLNHIVKDNYHRGAEDIFLDSIRRRLCRDAFAPESGL